MKKSLLILCIVINTLVMMLLTFYLMGLPWLAGDEKFLIWSTSNVKFANREMPDSKDFALINTSYDLTLIDRYDEFGFPVGNQAITDREKLTQLLSVINSGDKKPEFVVVDIHFVDATSSDTALYEELSKMDNIILSAHLNEEGFLEPPIFDGIPYGLSDYLVGSVFDGVYKYQLIFEDTLKLTPLKIYESQSGRSILPAGSFVKIGESWTTNNFIMNYRLLQKDIENLEAGFNPISLGELLYLEDADIRDYLAGKMVIIGDFFENDMHETIFEITAGPLILLNAYLTISHQDTVVNIPFFMLMTLVYAYLSFMVFHEGDFIEKRINKFTSQKVSRYFMGFTSYLVILAVYSIFNFFMFNVHINIFFIALAFYVLDRLVSWGYQLKKKRI